MQKKGRSKGGGELFIIIITLNLFTLYCGSVFRWRGDLQKTPKVEGYRTLPLKVTELLTTYLDK